MTDGPRVVRVSPHFFDALDRQLPAERGGEGQPSAEDFQLVELFWILEVFADRFEALPALFEGRGDYRVFIGAGLIVGRFAVVGQLRPDGSIDLVDLDIDEPS